MTNAATHTIVVNNVHFRDVRIHYHRDIGAISQSESETKSLCVLKNSIISDIDFKTLSVGRGVRGEGHKWIVG